MREKGNGIPKGRDIWRRRETYRYMYINLIREREGKSTHREGYRERGEREGREGDF